MMEIFSVTALRTPDLAYCLYFVKRGATHKTSVLREKQDGSSILLRQVGYPLPILVILEHGDVIFAYITEEHKSNDSLHTILLAQWQLAPLYKTGAI